MSISLLIIKNTKKSNALLVTNSYTYTETPFSPTRVYYVKRGSNYYFATVNGLVLTLDVTLLDRRYIVYPVVKYYYGDPSTSTVADSLVSYPLYNDSSPSYSGYAFPSGVVVDAFAITLLGLGDNTIKFTFSTATHVGNALPSFTYSSEVNIVLDKSTSSANTALYQFLTTAYPSIYYWNLVSVPTAYGIGTYEQGYAQGQLDAIAANKEVWYNNGYHDGVNVNLEENLGPLLIDDALSSIITAPVNFIKQVFNFDLFGFNVGGIFFGIATITLLIVAFGIIKKVVK